MNSDNHLSQVLEKHSESLLKTWIKDQETLTTRQKALLKEGEGQAQSAEFLEKFQEGAKSGTSDLKGENWSGLKELLASISKSRTMQGFTSSEMATFVFSFKQTLLRHLQKEFGNDPKTLIEELMKASELLDKLGLYITEVYQKTREEIISRQSLELLELSTPVVTLWDGILALPLIGTLDSARTQIVMESLLQKIVTTGSEIAIIDITGVPTVDTLVAQHLLKTVTAARLMGAECIISGIRPQIAQTIVHLGVELGDVITKSNLKDAFTLALKRNGFVLEKARPTAPKAY